MIYDRTPILFIISIIAGLGLFKRMTEYFAGHFDKMFAILISATILLHPLTIDAFLGPNILNGTIAFWLFLESLFFLQQEKDEFALACIFFAAVCNITYSLFPLFYFWKYFRVKKYIPLLSTYIVLLTLFLLKLKLSTIHNPLIFLSSYLNLLILPFSMTVLTPALFFNSWLSLFSMIFLFVIIFVFQKKLPEIKNYVPFIFLPLVGVFFHQWTTPVTDWSEYIFSGSTYLCITFSIIAIFSQILSKKWIVCFLVFTLYFTANWGMQWSSLSNVIKISSENLPASFNEPPPIEQLLKAQLHYEGKN